MSLTRGRIRESNYFANYNIPEIAMRGSKLHCPENVQYFTCAIESGFFEWQSSILSSDIEFLNSPVGTMKTQNKF